jgi:hypothetical protein
MVILVTSSSRAKECAAAIEQATHHETKIATSLSRAVDSLQTHDYDALVLDESFRQTEISAVNLLLNHAGLAVPIYVNLALHGAERVAREVQTGLVRFVREKLAAMRAAEGILRSELRGEVTGILLTSELALREPALPEAVAEKVQAVHDLAEKMRRRLEATQFVASVDAAQLPMVKAKAAARSNGAH